MSEENVEMVRSIYRAWEKGDFSNARWADDGIEYGLPSEGSVHGLAAMSKSWGEWMGSWEGVAATPERFVDAGDSVVVVHKWRGHGKRSGIPVEDFSSACVFTLRDGKVVRLILYANREEALKAAGLSE